MDRITALVVKAQSTNVMRARGADRFGLRQGQTGLLAQRQAGRLRRLCKAAIQFCTGDVAERSKALPC